jgi:hypothetical protein
MLLLKRDRVRYLLCNKYIVLEEEVFIQAIGLELDGWGMLAYTTYSGVK